MYFFFGVFVNDLNRIVYLRKELIGNNLKN